MTREEAIARIKNHKIAHKMNEPRAIYISEALDMAIEALEQEPCEDAVSRKTLISHIENQSREWGEDYDAQQILGDIEDMPPVKPQEPKTGYLINAKVGKLFPSNDFKCSKCGNILDFDGVNCGRGDANFCPNCGAKMVESEDRNDKRRI